MSLRQDVINLKAEYIERKETTLETIKELQKDGFLDDSTASLLLSDFSHCLHFVEDLEKLLNQ